MHRAARAAAPAYTELCEQVRNAGFDPLQRCKHLREATMQAVLRAGLDLRDRCNDFALAALLRAPESAVPDRRPTSAWCKWS